MPPLKNTRHEKFARELLTAPTGKDAYLAIHPNNNPIIASNSASRLLADASVKQRVAELLDAQELGLPQLVGCLKRHVYSENEGIALKAVEDGFKLHGCFDDEKSDINVNAIQINFSDAGQFSSVDQLKVSPVDKPSSVQSDDAKGRA